MPDESVHNWVQIHRFGQSKCFADVSSVRRRGTVAEVLLRYALTPPGVDKRDGRSVASMQTTEEYDLPARCMRARQITLVYVDGSQTILEVADVEWKAVTPGNEHTLRFLTALCRGADLKQTSV